MQLQRKSLAFLGLKTGEKYLIFYASQTA